MSSKALCDEGTSSLYRTVSEACRTACLQRNKVQQVVNGFADYKDRKGGDTGFNLESKLKQLRCLTCPNKDVTTGPSPCVADDDEAPVNPKLHQDLVDAVGKVEKAMEALKGTVEESIDAQKKLANSVLPRLLTQMNVLQTLTKALELDNEKVDVVPLFNEVINAVEKVLAPSKSGSTPAPRETGDEAKQDTQESVDTLHRLMEKVLELEEAAMDDKINDEFELKKFEDEFAPKWKQLYVICERTYKSWAACVGLRLALLIGIERIEETFLERSEACEAPIHLEPYPESEPSPEPPTSRAWGSLQIVDETKLSDYFEEGKDPKEREDQLKRNHPGSKDHPDGCRPCHFQAGLCWKGLACSFCHICPKPKRKSKHQRDVDKRRQERYKEVKDKLGEECLDAMTRIDEYRRQVMTASEDLKQFGKEAYSLLVDLVDSDDEKLQQFRRMEKTWSECLTMILGLVPRREVGSMESGTASGEFASVTASSDIASASGPSTSERNSSFGANVGGLKSSVFDTHAATKSQSKLVEKQTKTYPPWSPIYGAKGSAPTHAQAPHRNYDGGGSRGWLLDTWQYSPSWLAADLGGAQHSGTQLWANHQNVFGGGGVEELA